MRDIINDVRSNKTRVISDRQFNELTAEIEGDMATLHNPQRVGILDALVIGKIASLMRDYPDAMRKARPDLYENSPLAEACLAFVNEKLNEFKFSLLDVYPGDVLTIGRREFNDMCAPGVTLFICLGDRHLHITSIGLVPEDTKLINGLTNLAQSDRFYCIQCLESGQIRTRELTREKAKEQAATTDLYCRKVVHAEWNQVILHLQRSHAGDAILGRATIKVVVPSVGGCAPSCEILLYPGLNASPRDAIALRQHAEREMFDRYTLFVSYDVVTIPPAAH